MVSGKFSEAILDDELGALEMCVCVSVKCWMLKLERGSRRCFKVDKMTKCVELYVGLREASRRGAEAQAEAVRGGARG